MKLTWLGGQCVRLHLAGQVICFYPKTAAPRFTQVEILGAVDDVFDADSVLTVLSGDMQAQHPVQRRLIDSDESADVEPARVLKMSGGHIVVLAEGEASLVLVNALQANETDDSTPTGLENCVLLIHGAGEHELVFVKRMVNERRVKQIAVAMEEPSDADWSALVAAGQGIPMQLLDLGLALEV